MKGKNASNFNPSMPIFIRRQDAMAGKLESSLKLKTENV